PPPAQSARPKQSGTPATNESPRPIAYFGWSIDFVGTTTASFAKPLSWTLDHVSFPELDNVVHFLGLYRHHLAGPDQSAVAAHCINERRVQQSADFLRVVREVDDGRAADGRQSLGRLDPGAPDAGHPGE